MTPREHKVSKSIRVNECFRVIEVVVSTSLPTPHSKAHIPNLNAESDPTLIPKQ
jgi:hypothetical protein